MSYSNKQDIFIVSKLIKNIFLKQQHHIGITIKHVENQSGFELTFQ